MKNLIEPGIFVKNLHEANLLPEIVWPKSVIIRYAFSDLKTKDLPLKIDQKHKILAAELITFKDSRIAVLNKMSMGAPQLGIYFELLAELGVHKFVGIGSAGAIQPNLRHEEFVLCNKAWSDEGLSKHYGLATEYSYADEDLLRSLRGSFMQNNLNFHECASWTTDAFFRESWDKINHFQTLGISTVEMEASALYTLASYRKKQAAFMFVISDIVQNNQWLPQFRLQNQLWNQLLLVASDALHR